MGASSSIPKTNGHDNRRHLPAAAAVWFTYPQQQQQVSNTGQDRTDYEDSLTPHDPVPYFPLPIFCSIVRAARGRAHASAFFHLRCSESCCLQYPFSAPFKERGAAFLGKPNTINESTKVPIAHLVLTAVSNLY
jgi:hypothetical protein